MQIKWWLVGILAVTMTSCYSLEGVWSLQSPPSNSPVSLQISSFVFKNQQILQKLVFKSCQEMRLQASFSSNGVYINFKSLWVLPIANRTCDPASSAALDKLNRKLRTVFNFAIRNDSLVFQDPLNATVYTFKRVATDRKEDIEGVWTLRKFGNTTTSLAVTIGKGQINLCQGNTIVNYSLGRDKIQLQPVLSNCASISLAKTLNKTKYYRRKSDLLLFYDANLKPIMELVFTEPYQPEIETSKKVGNGSADITAQNITGKWSILSLFGAKFPQTPYSLAFNSSHLSLLGGCKNYSLLYSLSSSTQTIAIGRANLTSPKTCQQSDDQFYVSGLTKMMRYVIIKSDVSTSLRFYDDNGTAGYFLILTGKEDAITAVNKSAKPTISPAKPAQSVATKTTKTTASITTSTAVSNSNKLPSQALNPQKPMPAVQNINKPTTTTSAPQKPISPPNPIKTQPTPPSVTALGKKL